MDNFTAIRNGILDHIRDGKICPFDFGVYVFIHLRADWSSGICHACASTIAYQFGDPKLKKHIQRSLHRLRERKYINYLEGNGKRGSYPILIHKYGVAVGGLSGTRLNAWTHGDLVRPEYEPAGGSRAVEGQWGGSRGAYSRLKDFTRLTRQERGRWSAFPREGETCLPDARRFCSQGQPQEASY